MANAAVLKPCAFCGGEARRGTVQEGYQFGTPLVFCVSCDAQIIGPECEAEWNTRVADSQTCGNCRFRGEELLSFNPGTIEHQPSGFFPCERVKHDKGLGGITPGMPDYKGSGAVVVDGSGYHAALCVEEDFGCNKWELAT